MDTNEEKFIGCIKELFRYQLSKSIIETTQVKKIRFIRLY